MDEAAILNSADAVKHLYSNREKPCRDKGSFEMPGAVSDAVADIISKSDFGLLVASRTFGGGIALLTTVNIS